MTRVVREAVLDAEAVEEVLRPRRRVVEERSLGQGRYELAHGPLTAYRRSVTLERLPGGRSHVTQTVEYELAIPYFGWLFALGVRRVLGRLGDSTGPEPWWAPPDRLDARAANVLGVLAAASLVAGYLGTLISQTITFAAREFGSSEADEGVALATVRFSVLLALVLVASADRRGRRRLVLVSAAAGILVAATGALAPSLPWLAASQIGARSFSIALAVLIGIMAAEEMPAGARAYAASVLALAAALGAGACVAALPLADLAEPAWRAVYVVPLLGLPLVRGIARHLRESRRFEVPHAATPMAGHGPRFWLLGASFFLVALFTSPASQFLNEFLRTERDWSATRIAIFTLATNTPGGIGVVVGGRLAERGRRVVGAVALVGGTAATVVMFLSHGWPLWAWSIVGAVVGAATIPALGVYGPELFPTSLRGRANGGITFLGVLGSSAGLLAAGFLADRVGGLGHAIPLLAVGPAVVAVLVLTLYPETAHLELEDINPEDRPPPPTG